MSTVALHDFFAYCQAGAGVLFQVMQALEYCENAIEEFRVDSNAIIMY
jgi:hypothetical protein